MPEKKANMRQWKALPPDQQKLLFFQVIKENGEWQSVTVPAIFENEFNALITEYEHEKGIPIKAFQKWYNERIR